MLLLLLCRSDVAGLLRADDTLRLRARVASLTTTGVLRSGVALLRWRLGSWVTLLWLRLGSSIALLRLGLGTSIALLRLGLGTSIALLGLRLGTSIALLWLDRDGALHHVRGALGAAVTAA